VEVLMQVSATVRVRSGTADQNKPDRARLEQAARLLEKSGFNVLRIGRFGVSIRGEDKDFSRVLGVQPVAKQALAAPADPPSAELRDLVDLVEVTSEPTSY
jgi:hypothetical protein